MAEAPAPTHKRDVAEVGIGDEVAPAAKQQKLESEDKEDSDEDSDVGNDEDSDDWKATLFYWRGLLTHEPGSSTLSWEGAWVGSASGMPSDADFEASENTFQTHCPLLWPLPLIETRVDGPDPGVFFKARSGGALALCRFYLL